MSYDLLVFDAAEAPRGRAAFLRWHAGQAASSVPDRSDDPTDPGGPTERLRAWLT